MLDSLSSCRRKMVSQSDLLALRETWRGQGKSVVFTNGCFDLLHAGHLALLEQARALGDLLVVGVNGDASPYFVSKGDGRPFVPQEGRAILLAGFACVGWVVIFEEPTAEALVRALQPEVYVKGGDYGPSAGREPPEARAVAEYGGRVVFVPTLAGYSTSGLVERIRRLP